MGDVTFKIERVRTEVKITAQGGISATTTANRANQQWVNLINNIAKNEIRNELILSHLLKDCKKKKVLVVTERVEHVNWFSKKLTKADISHACLTSRTPKVIRDKLHEAQIVIAIKQMLTLGIKIPADIFYQLFPVTSVDNLFKSLTPILVAKITDVTIKAFLDRSTITTVTEKYLKQFEKKQ